MTKLKTNIDKLLKMKKSKLNLIFLFVILILIILFVYSGLNYYDNAKSNNEMIWIGAKFKMTTISKIIGIGLLLSITAYFIMRKKNVKTED